MISEGSCDTEYWSNDAENSALHHRNKLRFKIYSNRKQFILIAIIFKNIAVFTVFLILKNASLVNIRDGNQKHLKILYHPQTSSDT